MGKTEWALTRHNDVSFVSVAYTEVAVFEPEAPQLAPWLSLPGNIFLSPPLFHLETGSHYVAVSDLRHPGSRNPVGVSQHTQHPSPS